MSVLSRPGLLPFRRTPRKSTRIDGAPHPERANSERLLSSNTHLLKGLKKPCFSEFIDHGHGKYTLFGRVLAGKPDDPGSQHIRSASILIPPALDIDHYVVSATFVTEDPNDANQYEPFFPR